MKLVCLGSSSSGNCYLLKCNGETLIIEAGIRFADIKRGLEFHLSDVVGALVTHKHKDHSLCVDDLAKAGIHVYTNKDVADLHKSHFIHSMDEMKAQQIGGFKVMALNAVHDVPCFSFVIKHDEFGKMLFVTDSAAFDYSIKGVNHLLIEANYEDSILAKNIEIGIEIPSQRARLLQTHCEINTSIRIINAQDLTQVSDVVLLHLSSRNSDTDRFKTMVELSTGIPTYIAKKGFQIELTNG